MNAADTATDVARTFVLLHERLTGGGTREAALRRLVDLAVVAVPGCSWAAVTAWPVHGHPYSLATSDEVAADVDRLQYETGQGPCLDAAGASPAVRSPDLGAERRWPAFRAAALKSSPVRGIMAFLLAEQPLRTALNLYSPQPGAFDMQATAAAVVFAAQARILTQHAETAEKAANLAVALDSSRAIGAAVGILMNAHKVTEEQAFTMLRISSQHLNRKLRDVAEVVTETGTLPDPR